jgi:ribosomal-protein-alanine N-acetyltransferase
VYELRPFDPKDLFDVMGIVNNEMRYEYSPEVYLSMHNAWPDGFVVATYYRKVIGFIMAGITPQHDLRVLLLVIRSEFKSKGLGRRLMDHMERKAKFRGINRLTLEVRVSNEEALRFYRRFGMRVTGRTKGFYKDGEDALVLEKVLSS